MHRLGQVISWGAASLMMLVGAANARASSLEVSAGHESLSRGLQPWQEQQATLKLDLDRYLGSRAAVIVNAHRVKRFGISAQEAGVLLVGPIVPNWGFEVGGTVGGNGGVLPSSSLNAQLNHALGDGWVASGGWLRRIYASANTNAYSVIAEKYLGDWRLAGTFTYARANQVPVGSALRLQADRYFGDRGRLGVALATGREIDVTTGVPTASNVRSLVVGGKLPLGQAWAVLGEWGVHQQSSSYRRLGGRLGVEFQF